MIKNVDVSSPKDDSMSFLRECLHEYIKEGFCANCGFGMGPRLDFDSIYYKGQMSAVNNTQKGYETELSKIGGFSETLTNLVKTKLKNEKRPAKETTRKLDVFCQFYVEGASLGEINPVKIAKKLKLNGRNLNKSLRIVSGTSKKSVRSIDGIIKTLQVVSISPVDCLKDICNMYDNVISECSGERLETYYDEFVHYLKLAIKKSPSLLNERPKYVAIGFVKYYCGYFGIELKNIGKIVDISVPTLNQYSSKMKKLFDLHKIKFDHFDQ
jgi:hypothetical protein